MADPRLLHSLRIAAALALAALLSKPAISGPFGSGNLLISTEEGVCCPFTSTIHEFTPGGGLVQTLIVPRPGDTHARDLAIDDSGLLQVFNGTFDPWLSTYSPFEDVWVHHTHPGWSIINNGTYGAVAAHGEWIFVPDHETFGPGDAPLGIIRFIRSDFSADRFATDFSAVDLNVGLDDRLYALGSTGSPNGVTLRVYDPASMTLIWSMNMPSTSNDYRALTADASSRIFVVGHRGQLLRLSPAGLVEKSTDTTAIGLGFHNIGDLDLDPSGMLAIGTRFGDVLITDTEFDPAHSWQFAAPGGQQTFVTWVPGIPVPVKTRSWGAIKALYR